MSQRPTKTDPLHLVTLPRGFPSYEVFAKAISLILKNFLVNCLSTTTKGKGTKHILVDQP